MQIHGLACKLALACAVTAAAEGNISVRDMGAIGDGKTDDTNAFLQAVEAAADKLEMNAEKYPADKVRGKALKYSDYHE